MDEIVTLVEIDWKSVIIALVLALGFVVALLKALEYLAEKFGIETKKQRDHKLLIQTSQNLTALQEQHTKDIKEFKDSQTENVNQSIRHDEIIKEELKSFIDEIRSSIVSLTNQMNQYSENRIHDREQSFEIQRQLNKRSDDRDKKI